MSAVTSRASEGLPAPTQTVEDGPPRSGDRQARRKATTRATIAAAADELFGAKGFDATTIAEISDLADVAVRTIYLHFDSKAAILLAYFEDWLDDLTTFLCRRPIDERLDEMVIQALTQMVDAGWTDSRAFAQMERPHPLLESLAGGNPEVAGRVMQSWVAAQTRLVDHFRQTGDYPPGSLEPRVRAATLFANWMATVLSYQDEFDGKTTTAGMTTYEVSIRAIRLALHGSGEARVGR